MKVKLCLWPVVYSLLVISTIVTATLDSCPIEIEQCGYATDRMEANDNVRQSVVNVFSNIFNTTIA